MLQQLYLTFPVLCAVCCRYSEESLCLMTQDSMTVREIGAILLCCINLKTLILYLLLLLQ